MNLSALILGAAMLAQSAPAPAKYTVHRVDSLPPPSAAWDDPAWVPAATLSIDRAHPRSSGHHPPTQARLLHDGRALAVIFRVEDRHVLARHTAYQSPTHKDSCVEFFVKPHPDRGYFNFEFNALGTLLLWYIEKPRGPDGVFGKYTEIPRDAAAAIAVHASLKDKIESEREQPLTWTLSYRVPVALLEKFTGPLSTLSGQTWRANFYKCADDSTHPHWLYWNNIGDRLDFHQPDRFGEILFE